MAIDLTALRARGEQLIGGSKSDASPLPLVPWRDVLLRFTVEYGAADFAAEVAFWADIFGWSFLSLSDDYAIVTDGDGSFTFSFRAEAAAADLSGIRLQWFTDDLNAAADVLRARGLPFEVLYQSPEQRYVRLTTPAGVTVEIWSGLESHCP